LLCRTLQGWGQLKEALAESEGLMTAADSLGRRDLIAESAVVRAELFEKLEQYDDAIGALRQCLTTNLPPARQRQALKKIAAIALAQNQFATATDTLETYLSQFPEAPAADIAWLTLGEVQLKQHVTGATTNQNGSAAAATNRLAQALSCFDRVIHGFSNSTYVGQAQLNRGWVYWIQEKYPASALAFQAAADVLPQCEELAVARFKLADALFAQSNYAAALEQYRAATAVATNWPAVQAALKTPALYQSLQASLQVTNLAAAEETMRGIVASLPAGDEDAVRGVLLVAQGYVDATQPDEAKRLFHEFVDVFPGSALRPQAEMLIASVQEQQQDWRGAITTYDAWLERFPTNDLRPQVEFQRALDTARAGNATNALTQFTNFVARFRGNALAPHAQWWIADHFFSQADYTDAEIAYKGLFQTWTNSSLAPRARLMAGRAAYERRDFPNAIESFTSLSSDTNCPEALWVQAVLGYGGAKLRQATTPAETNKLTRFAEAVAVFSQIQQRFPTNESTAAAWGEMGNCYLQMAALEPRYYDSASNAYQQAMVATNANITVRSIAQVGLAQVLEKVAETGGGDKAALLRLARDSYWDVARGQNVRPGEDADLFWRKEAGLRLLKVLETLQDWSTLLKLADQLEAWFPQLHATLAPKRERALKMISAGEAKSGFDSP
jgi:TolA-binding protein